MLPRRQNRVVIRKSHPSLYRSLMVLAIMSVAMAVNFWTSNPTFDPFGIDNNLIGGIFLLIGVWHLVYLNLIHNLKLVRLGSTFAIFFMTAWGLGNMQQSLAGRASFQLPILYLALAGVYYLLLGEPPVNPMTRQQ